MKVLYLGCFCEPTTMPLINKRTKGRISVSATTFQRALLHGYDKLEYKPNYIVNVPDIGSFPMRCSSPFFPRSKFEFASMKGVNGAFPESHWQAWWPAKAVPPDSCWNNNRLQSS